LSSLRWGGFGKERSQEIWMAKEQRTLTNREAVWSKTCDWGKGMDVD